MPPSHPLGSLLGGLRIEGERAADAAKLNQDVVAWLKTDEHAVGGRSGIQAVRGRGSSDQAADPAQAVEPEPAPESDPLARRWTWSVREEGAADLGGLVLRPPTQLHQKLEANPRYRLTIEWTIEEEPQ